MKCRKDYADPEKFRAYRNRYKNRYNRKRNFSDGGKRPWTDEETKIVMEHKITDTEIAKQLRRSLLAVQARRQKMREAMKQEEP